MKFWRKFKKQDRGHGWWSDRIGNELLPAFRVFSEDLGLPEGIRIKISKETRQVLEETEFGALNGIVERFKEDIQCMLYEGFLPAEIII